MADRGRGGCGYPATIGCGSLLAVFGATLIGGTLLSFGEDGKVAGEVALMVFFGVAPLIGGVALIVRAVKARRRQALEAIERQVLRLAEQWGGVVSPMRVAAETDLSLDEAKRYLDRLADQGHVDLAPSDSGMVYRFPGAEGPPRG